MRRSTVHQSLRIVVALLMAVGFAVFASADADVFQEPSPEMIEAGKAIYTDQCQSCHGAEGKGDGPASRFLSPKPRDLSGGEFVHAEDGSVAAVAAVIKAGVDETGMTPFESQLSDEQITSVAAYVVHVLAAGGGDRR